MTGLPDISARVKICPICKLTFYSSAQICLKCQSDAIDRAKLPEAVDPVPLAEPGTIVTTMRFQPRTKKSDE